MNNEELENDIEDLKKTVWNIIKNILPDLEKRIQDLEDLHTVVSAK